MPSIREELAGALREFIYETTHLSPEEDNGSHKCFISKATLQRGRDALARSNATPDQNDTVAGSA